MTEKEKRLFIIKEKQIRKSTEEIYRGKSRGGLGNFARKPYSDEAETAWKNACHTVRNFAKKIVKRSLAYAIINMSTGWKDAEKAIIGPVG